MAVQTVFERNEKKFLLPKRELADILRQLEPQMQADDYGLHTICSLYYDTPGFACAQAQLDKPVYREKLRLRSYGVPTNADTVYLELKKKFCGVTYKRRMPLTLGEAKAYLQHRMPPLHTGQVFGEIDWFITQNRPEPKALVCYDRLALTGRQDESLRLTFDSRIRWRADQLDLSRGDWGAPLLSGDSVLLEVKTPGAIPLWLCRVLSARGIYTQSYSKYLNSCQSLLEQEVMRHAG